MSTIPIKIANKLQNDYLLYLEKRKLTNLTRACVFVQTFGSMNRSPVGGLISNLG